MQVKWLSGNIDVTTVEDNGHGVTEANAVAMGREATTSKIGAFADLELLDVYGFRGQALHVRATNPCVQFHPKWGSVRFRPPICTAGAYVQMRTCTG